MACGGYDVNELDDQGFLVLEKIAAVLGPHNVTKIKALAANKNRNVSTRQKRYLKIESTFYGRRKRKRMQQ